MRLLKNNLFIALCISLTIALIFAWNNRWDIGPKHTDKSDGSDIIYYYKKDKWTEENWIVTSGYDRLIDRYYYGSQKPVSNSDNAWLHRNLLTFLWCLFTFLSLLFSIFGLLEKNKKAPLD